MLVQSTLVIADTLGTSLVPVIAGCAKKRCRNNIDNDELINSKPFSSPEPSQPARIWAQESKGSGDKEFPVLDSGTSSLHVYSRDVYILHVTANNITAKLTNQLQRTRLIISTDNFSLESEDYLRGIVSNEWLSKRMQRLREAKRAIGTRMLRG